MARVASQHAHPPAEVIAPRGADRDTLVLSWTISRAAAVSCGLVSVENGPGVSLEVLISAPGNGQATIEARLLDGDRQVPLESSPRCAAWIEDSIRGVWHLDIDGLLKLTVRSRGNDFEALYARTELLSRAGIAGGRYEFEGAALRRIDSAD